MTVSRWESGDAPVKGPVLLALKVLEAKAEKPVAKRKAKRSPTPVTAPRELVGVVQRGELVNVVPLAESGGVMVRE
jgi:hypothetical protein